MNDKIDPADGSEHDTRDRLDIGDQVLRKSRLLARECDTCIFRPGNLMHLHPGRLRQMVTEARGSAGYIVCHSTLPYGQSDMQPAICRGFADRYSTWQLQVMQRLWGFVDVEPPHAKNNAAGDDDAT